MIMRSWDWNKNFKNMNINKIKKQNNINKK